MKLRKYFTISILSLSLISCNDWLDVEPSTEIDRGSLMSNEAGFADAMSGVYACMTSDALYGKNLSWYLLEIMGGGTIYSSGDNGRLAAYYFHPDASYYYQDFRTSYIDPIWNKQYNAIANLNSILEVIDEHRSVFAGEDYQIFKGEALGLRAFLHFDLLRLFGNAYEINSQMECIPYVNKLTSEVHPLLTVEDICESILFDLDEAEKLLIADPMFTGKTSSEYVCNEISGSSSYRVRYNIEDWHNRRFHFNYYAVMATKARVYLWMGNKIKALEYAKKVIEAPEKTFSWVNTTLIANVNSASNYVCRDRTFCTEHVFALNITDLPDRTDGYLWAGEKTLSNVLGVNVNDAFDATTRNYDPRYAYLKTTYNYGGREYILSSKYVKDYDPYNYSPWAANRLPLIRVSEMYYIAAECEPILDNAIGYLEEVRKHRGMSAYPLDCNNEEKLQQEIEKEYRKEFISEGQLFYYFKRLNKTIHTKDVYSRKNIIEPNLFTMPRPEDEDIYGGRMEETVE